MVKKIWFLTHSLTCLYYSHVSHKFLMANHEDNNMTRQRHWIYDMERQRFDSNINWKIIKLNLLELKNEMKWIKTKNSKRIDPNLWFLKKTKKNKLTLNLNLWSGCFWVEKLTQFNFFLSNNPRHKLLNSRHEIIKNWIKDNKS